MNESAKELASKHLGKNAINYITALVLIGVVSSMFLESSTLPAVIGLVATSSMALIGILQHIVGAKEKEDKPEITIIRELINEVSKDKSEPMQVDVSDGRVVISKGNSTITNNNTKKPTKHEKGRPSNGYGHAEGSRAEKRSKESRKESSRKESGKESS